MARTCARAARRAPALAAQGADHRQQGYPELEGNDAFINIAAPKGTPPAVLAKLEASIQKTMEHPSVRKKLDELEVQAVFMTSKETRKWLEDDVRKFSGIIKEVGLAVK